MYRMVPFLMTLNEPQSRFQGHDIILRQTRIVQDKAILAMADQYTVVLLSIDGRHFQSP